VSWDGSRQRELAVQRHLEEALFDARLHPRDRMGRWRVSTPGALKRVGAAKDRFMAGESIRPRGLMDMHEPRSVGKPRGLLDVTARSTRRDTMGVRGGAPQRGGKVAKVKVPATRNGPEVTAELTPVRYGDFEPGDRWHVTVDGRVLGTIDKGEYTYAPRAAGFQGKVVRYSTGVTDWRATAPDGAEYRGGVFPSHYRKNSRKAAIAFLVAHDAGDTSARYFTWA
jgi:hypothetical protein